MSLKFIGLVMVLTNYLQLICYQNSSATQQVLDKEGWFSTGDIGWIAPHHSRGRSHRCGGVIVLDGRAKDTIVLLTGKKLIWWIDLSGRQNISVLLSPSCICLSLPSD